MRGGRTAIEAEPHWAPGFVLLEVMVAIVILGIVLVPLATCVQRATDAGVALRGKATGFSQGVLVDVYADAWTWGQMIERVVWQPGPELRVRVRSSGSTELALGMWAGGWLLGEWTLGGELELAVPAPAWEGVEGQELIVRVREAHGGWGPPWRCIVPNEYGEIVAETALSAPEAGAGEGSAEERSCAHARCLAAPSLWASWADEPVSETVLGLVYLLPRSGPGCCELTVDGEVQAWFAVEDRNLDVYF